MLQTITQIISVITVLQLLLFSVFLLSVKRKSLNHFILTAFLIVNALFIINFLIPALERFFNISLIHFRFIGFSFGFLFGPLLYFFTKFLIYKNFRLKKTDSIYIIPFLIHSATMIFAFHILSEEVKIKLLYSNNVLPIWISHFNFLFLNLQILCYMAASVKLINDYGKELKNVYAAIENINLSWLKLILYAFIFMWIIDFSHFILRYITNLSRIAHQIMTFVSLSINFVFAIVLVLKALRHPELFFVIEQKQEKSKYENSPLSKDQSELYLKKLIAFMKSEKPYLVPSLTINILSERISLQPKILSQVINENMQQNFFDFINHFRIEEAKEILSNPIGNKTVLEILYEVGFNSKSVFNTAFKKHTGITPTQFKRQVHQALVPNRVA